ncbi:ubiquitin-protein ligase [Anopheles darlingi]|uniref:Ubiquitin-protein ligase E3A n=1 Tax=Anopheles darlingi TaxID=43151 RepID=W5JTJ0_ANODA|nr:ubiquitin-protein ligase [Anopheles darlingi]
MNQTNEKDLSDDDSRIDEVSPSPLTAATSCNDDETNSNNQHSSGDRGMALIHAGQPSSSVGLASEEQELKRATAKKLIEQYFYQLIDGCGNAECTNKHCASSGKVEKLSPNAAAARAIQLFSQEATLCYTKEQHRDQNSQSHPRSSTSSSSSSQKQRPASLVPENQLECTPEEENQNMEVTYECSESVAMEKDTAAQSSADIGQKEAARSGAASTSFSCSTTNDSGVDGKILKQLCEQCIERGCVAAVVDQISAIFSSCQLLANSFQCSKATSSIDRMLARAPQGDLRMLKKEDLRSLEGDLDKDEDSKAPVEESPQEPSDPAHTSVDLASLRSTMKALYTTQASVFDHIDTALQELGENLSVELQGSMQSTEQLETVVTALVIIIETLLIGSAIMIEGAFPRICSAVGMLPVKSQARLVRIWAHHCPDSIHSLLQQLQQLVTISILSPTLYRPGRVHNNEDVGNAIKTMKLVFYANILAGELESTHFRETDLRDTSLPTYLSLIPEDDDDDGDGVGAGVDGEDDLMDDDDESIEHRDRRSKQRQKYQDPLEKELDVNPLDCRKPLVPYSEFYNETLCDQIEMDHDYLVYKSMSSLATNGSGFCFMYYSFVLTPATKTLALYYDSRIRMFSERRLSVLYNASTGNRTSMQGLNPFLNLRIRRDHVVDDALVELEIIAMSNPKDLKKQLVVEFTGEQGIDEGGVSKEFFQLIVEEIFNPDYGMFVTNEDSSTVWFNPSSFENEAQFTLIGIVLGLAIYNNIILAVEFPMVVYRKLMGMKGSFLDLKDLNPVLFNSLNSLLEYTENDMEEVFMQTFKIGYRDVFGNTLEHELKPDGDKIFVTQENKQEFIELYSDFLLNQSVQKQFHAFRRGFQMVTDESPLHLLFRPEEIELIVCGSKEFDFDELEKSTEYEGGFTAESQTIKDFWTIVHGLSMEAKRKLLQFTTGSDRVPVGGLSRLKMVIARNGPDCDRLPTSHTCFNVLLLPEYDSKEKLEERLLKAINYSKGFGML